MINAIIFDFFGVLAVRGLKSLRETYYAGDEAKEERHQKLEDQMNLGVISYDDFIDGLAKIAGVNRDEVLKYTEGYKANQPLLAYIRNELKPSYKIGIISNAGGNWVPEILGQKNVKLFEDIVLSYRVNIIKPEPEIYELSAKNLGVKPIECVFTDDLLTYCRGAESVGMSTVWFKDSEQFKSELEKILD